MVILNELNLEVVGERPAIECPPARSQDVPVSVPGIFRACEDLGWGLQTDLVEGIARTWDWVCPLSERRVAS
jgi:nucleoside-diphosphate-sugar epimerase